MVAVSAAFRRSLRRHSARGGVQRGSHPPSGVTKRFDRPIPELEYVHADTQSYA